MKFTKFGLNARTAMLKKGITLTALAKQLGICRPYVTDIFNGNRKGKKHVNKIAEILEIDSESGEPVEREI